MALNDQELKRINELEARLDEIERQFHIFDLKEIARLEAYVSDDGNMINQMYIRVGRSTSKERLRISKDVSTWFSKLDYQSLMRIKNTSLLRKELKTRGYDRTSRYGYQIESLEQTKKEIKQRGYKLDFFSLKPSKEKHDSDLKSISDQVKYLSDSLANTPWELRLLNKILDVADKYSDEISQIDREILSIKQSATKRNKEMLLAAKMAKAAAADEKVRVEISSFKVKNKKTKDCPYCAGPLGNIPHLDHIYPVSKGGLNLIENLVYCCETCNRAKSDKSLRQFCKEQGFDYLLVTDRLADMDKHI